MGRIALIVFIVVFWIAYPVMAPYSGLVDVKELDISDLGQDNLDEGVLGGIFTSTDTFINTYFGILTMTIPGVPTGMRVIVWILQTLSLLAVYLLLRI